VAQNFLPCDRDQELLLPPSLREWLPEDHLAWFVLDSVAELDLDRFYSAYRSDGWGAAAHDPQMMVALLLYAYSIGVRSARGIERRCSEDVAFRVIAANQIPDHATIARFRARHEQAISELFSGVLSLCARAGLVKVGIVAIDGTKIAAATTHHANRSYEQIARRSSRRPVGSTPPRTSSTVRHAVTSCPRGCARLAIGASGCARQSRRSRQSARRRQGRFRAIAASASRSARPGSSRIGGSSSASSQSTRLGTRAGSQATARGG
jgi:transposase